PRDWSSDVCSSDLDAAAVLLGQELRDVVPDVPEPLDRHALPFEAPGQTVLLHVGLDLERLADAVLHAATGGLLASADAPLRHRLAGHAGERVDLPRRQRLVGVGDPG